MKATATTTIADEIAALFGNDGHRFEAVELEGMMFQSVCRAHDRFPDINRHANRYTFSDGSVLLDLGDCWDFGYPECWCSREQGHALDCYEAGE